MARRNYDQAAKGQTYASEWPEWHVDCAVEDCDAHILVASVGECWYARDADRLIRDEKTGDNSNGWKRRGGLWYCPKHAEGS